MTKKEYEKPTVKVVQLRHRILLTSGAKTLSGSQGATQEEDTWYELQ
ncbi:MAG: hypothetical protein IJP74_07585 [Prevotella sp.]|nr:hypothetical protein [Prevotella sp.]